MLIEVTTEKAVGAVTILVAAAAWLLSILRGKFVTRKEWHDNNNAYAATIGSLQSDVAKMAAQLTAGDSRMCHMEAHINSIDASSRAANEGIARIEGILLGKEVENKRRSPKC